MSRNSRNRRSATFAKSSVPLYHTNLRANTMRLFRFLREASFSSNSASEMKPEQKFGMTFMRAPPCGDDMVLSQLKWL